MIAAEVPKQAASFQSLAFTTLLVLMSGKHGAASMEQAFIEDATNTCRSAALQDLCASRTGPAAPPPPYDMDRTCDDLTLLTLVAIMLTSSAGPQQKTSHGIALMPMQPPGSLPETVLGLLDR